MSKLRQKIAFSHDLIMAFLSLPIAMFLRMGRDMFIYDVSFVVFAASVFAVVAGACFWILNLYGGIWRYASLNDLMAILKAVTLAILVFVPLMFMLNRLEWIPRSTPMINWFVLATLLGAPRFLYRQFKDRRASNKVKGQEAAPKVPVLLVGAADGAEMFIRTIVRNPTAAYRIVGIVGENSGRVGRNIHGVHVLGTIDSLPSVYKALEAAGKTPQRIIVTKDDIEKSSMQKLITHADTLGVSLARLPRLTDFQSDVDEITPIRPIAIEDVLGRAQHVLDRASMQLLVKGRRVMVTGAGGTIGGELSRQLAEFSPSHLCLLDASEYALYSIDLEIKEKYPNLRRNSVIANVRDKGRLSRVFTEETPELVFHAAALKHVPIVEAHPSEGVMTNIDGTRNIADCCSASGVSAMVLISTDKAVNPTNVMGASKRIAETYCQALDLTESTTTRFVTVRFGNVLGSTGSVVPLFQRQLANGGPLTVTHPDMNRYFMTVREAVELVLEATVLGEKQDSAAGRVYVLDMGEPVKIVDLARQMILLAGLQPDEDIKIEFTGPRPGEKLFEEILHDSEPPEETDYAGIMLAAPRTIDLQTLSKQIDEITAAAQAGNLDEIIALIRAYVPEFQPEAGGPIRAVAS
ncbi:MAG: NAD-dependent epimerase/dehydratase family protein [Alphaproteobacteria bacterium]|nr:NAD-dependent epimerase/dehydratase family protein [Alphaproteobacteria bacterium]